MPKHISHLQRYDKQRPRRILHGAIVLWLIVQLSGCAPVYRGPKYVDPIRVQPTKQELIEQPIVQPHGLPLPIIPPVTDPGDAALPVSDPSVPPRDRPIALDEAIRIALSNSGVVRVLSGGDVSAVAATPYDPHIADTRLRAAMAMFDPVFTSSVYANWISQPPDAIFGPGLAEPALRDEAGLTAAVSKPWLTGGETRIGYNPPLGYLYLPDPSSSTLNPLYTSNLEFLVRQPLLKGSGIAVNKAPIRISQIRRDQSALETAQAVMASVRSVTEAYWELYSARNAAQVLSEVVPLLQRVAQIEHERMEAQRSVRADVAKAHSELHAVRLQLVETRAAVVQRELRLRNLLGLVPCDGYVLVPTSEPLQAPVALDPAASIAMAHDNRPDLQRQQLAVKTRENELLVAKNFGLPQLDATGLYRWNGVGDGLDDSLSQMLGTKYQDWQTSMTLTVPLGRRAGSAGIRAATLQLARERAMMQQALHATSHQISSLIQEVAYTHELFREADARWKANTIWLEGSKIRYENPPPAGDGQDWLLAATNDYLSALRSQADAARNAQSYLARYNALLARFNEARGTILFDSNLELMGDAPVNGAAQSSPSSLPEMPPIPAATPFVDLPSQVAPLMPLSELPPLSPGYNVPADPSKDPIAPPSNEPLPNVLPPPSSTQDSPPQAGALYPRGTRSYSTLKSSPSALPSQPWSCISPPVESRSASREIESTNVLGVRVIGVGKVTPSFEASQIVERNDLETAPSTNLVVRVERPSVSTVAPRASSPMAIGVRQGGATSPASSGELRFPTGRVEVPATARRISPPGPLNLFQPAPIHR